MQDQKKSLEERLEAHPILKSRIESLLDVVENAAGDLEKADAAEQRVIEELRQMGNDALHGWALNIEKKKSDEFYTNNDDVTGHGKKKSTGIQRLEK